MKLVKKLLLGLAFAAAAGSAAAVPFNITSGSFTIGSGYGTANGQLDAVFTSTFTPQTFSLNPGQSTSFAFGNVQLRESCINTGNLLTDLFNLCGIGGNERDNLGVTANLTFTDPLAGLVQSVAITGAIAGPVEILPLGITDLFINFNPVTVNFGAGGIFTVNLSDMVFDSQETLGTSATITLVAAGANAVPEPATLALLAMGLIGVAGARRRKQAV